MSYPVLSNYTIIELVATGTAGRVYKARNETTKEIVAIKAPILKSGQGRGKESDSFIKEFKMLSHLQTIYPTCVPFMTCVHELGYLTNSIFKKPNDEYAKKKKVIIGLQNPDAQVLCLVMEYLPGYTLGSIESKLKEKELICVMRSLFYVTSKFHELGLIHRDMDENNIYFTADKLILIDYEKSCIVDNKNFECTETGDIKLYRSLSDKDKLDYLRKHDIFGIGQVLYYLAHHKHLVYITDKATLPTAEIAAIINMCLDQDWRKIPSAKELLHITETKL